MPAAGSARPVRATVNINKDLHGDHRGGHRPSHLHFIRLSSDWTLCGQRCTPERGFIFPPDDELNDIQYCRKCTSIFDMSENREILSNPIDVQLLPLEEQFLILIHGVKPDVR